ncbi:hypothetical protein GCM10009863_49540 [Streptomyces axinellae]|uniref:Uncharacterized protein n=1 Tax=Streptomyces axinellae TaxID=552788 RepID=A0ABP6CU47_9ACTN
MLVQVRGSVLVLERLVRHDMTPVARRITDRQQYGYITPPSLLERGRLPGPPVDGVAGVLEEVGRLGVGQTIHTGIVA